MCITKRSRNQGYERKCQQLALLISLLSPIFHFTTPFQSFMFFLNNLTGILKRDVTNKRYYGHDVTSPIVALLHVVQNRSYKFLELAKFEHT
ncbi:hypothetical protein WN51_07596 [Melipona quadrifasciata]|uniref:Uncharacterized protein n=1 Tax=Melipona quadrifasciata TaxID=166423 RepID=A0A0M8ZRD3_9HYME|nr:hypothetical protein WN51_07596 [Melipona quadrifasciata]